MSLLGGLLSTVFERRYRGDKGAGQVSRPFADLTVDLMRTTGEGTGMAVARAILDKFAASDDDEKLAFFRHLAEDLTISPEDVRTALDAYEQGQTKASYRAFMTAAEPPRQELIRRLNQVPGATRQLVAMRADLLRLGRGEAALDALDLDFRHLLSSWFNRGFLVLMPITWESPAHILEKIIAYEAVHAIDSWGALRARLEPADRRCFAFFHPAMPDEPLIFVEVALTGGIPGSVQGVLSEDRPVLEAEGADTAVFYSISNCQAGLASISFGNSLIKQVAADLSTALPNLKTFVTLSPIPGFAAWLQEAGYDVPAGDPARLTGLTALYLTTAKRPDGLPRDPVARFHLGNGAEVHRLHANADVSPKGMQQSHGVMVNYLYDLSRGSQNHERYAASSEIAASPEIRALTIAAEKAKA